MSYKYDYSFGIQKEGEILPIIRNYFERDIQKCSQRYELYDFFDEKYKYELKSRNINYSEYEKTIIPADKICKGLILLFNFKDGLYYIKYRKSKFDMFERKLFVRNQRNDYNDIPKEYIYIPIDKLKKIN
jgi:hypothetical protein